MYLMLNFVCKTTIKNTLQNDCKVNVIWNRNSWKKIKKIIKTKQNKNSISTEN